MEGITLTGVPAEYALMVQTLIGVVAGLIVNAATAITKQSLKTNGNFTRAVSAVLALLVSLGFAVFAALKSGGDVQWGKVLFTALWAFVQSNGVYLMTRQAQQGAVKQAARPEPQTITPEGQVVPVTAEHPAVPNREVVLPDGTRGELVGTLVDPEPEPPATLTIER